MFRFEPDNLFADPDTLVMHGPCPPETVLVEGGKRLLVGRYDINDTREVALGRIFFRSDIKKFHGVIYGMSGGAMSADRDEVKGLLIAAAAMLYQHDEESHVEAEAA